MRDIQKYTQEYMEEGFERYQVIYRRRHILSTVLKYRPQRILEIGCGMCPLFQYMDYPYAIHVTVEPSEIFYKNALEILAREGGKAESTVCINECFHADKRMKAYQFDMVICAALLHELENPEEMLRDIRAVCSGCTTVYLNVPNAESVHRKLAKAMGLISETNELTERNIRLQQNRVFHMQTLRLMAEQAGFQVITSGTLFIKPFTHEQMRLVMEKEIFGEEVLEGLYRLGEMEEFDGLGSELYMLVQI